MIDAVSMALNDQIALVTGASRGIGRAIALGLGRLGARVIINYAANQPAAEETLKLLTDAGGAGELAPFDVSDERQVDSAVKKIVDRHKKIDIVVNNAGVTSDNLLVRLKSE